MITLSGVTFIIIVQTIIILTIISLWMFFLWRGLKKKQVKLDPNTQSESENSSSSIEHYLTSELKLIESRLETLSSVEKDKDEDVSESDLLILRKEYLENEKVLSKSKEREDVFWQSLEKNLQNILMNCSLVKRKKLTENETDEEEMLDAKKIMAQQSDEFKNIIDQLEADDVKGELKELKEKLSKISRSHTELSHCIAIIEDENLFLRDQIKCLLESM